MNGFNSYVEIQTKPNLFCSHCSLLLSPSLIVIELDIVIAPGISLSVLQFSSLNKNQDFPTFPTPLPSSLKNKYKEVVLVYWKLTERAHTYTNFTSHARLSIPVSSFTRVSTVRRCRIVTMPLAWHYTSTTCHAAFCPVAPFRPATVDCVT